MQENTTGVTGERGAQDWPEKEAELRLKIVDWILTMKNDYNQPDYARQALIDYDRLLPWLGLKSGVREAMKVAA